MSEMISGGVTGRQLDDREQENRALRSVLDEYRSMLDKYRTLADCSLAGIYVVQDGRFQYVNPRFVEMLGNNREEDLIGQEFWSVVHRDDRLVSRKEDNSREPLEVFPGRFTFRAKKKDGSTVWLDQRGTYAQYLGRPANIGTVVDVTDQKMAEEKLRQSEEKYRTIIDHIEDGYYEVDRRGDLVFFNDAFARILGFSRHELYGMSYNSYTNPKQACNINQTFNEVYSTGYPRRSIAWEIIRKDGEIRHLELSISLIRDRENRRMGFRGIARDVTERKLVERELKRHRSHLEELVQERTGELTEANESLQQEVIERQKAESKLLREKDFSESVVNSLPGAFYVFSESGYLVRWNENLESLTGYSMVELKDKYVLEFFEHHAAELVMQSVQATFNEGRASLETNVLAKDGRATPYYFSAVRAWRDGNKFLVGVGMDISERKKFEKALLNSEKELRVLSTQLISAQEEERRRVALELHDGVGQALTATKFSLEGAVKRLEGWGIDADRLDMLQSVIPTLQRAIDEVRRLSMDLRPSMIDDLGIRSTVTWFCREFQRIYMDIVMDSRIEIDEHQVPDYLKIVIYRVIQEALNNVAKHSRADRVCLIMRQDVEKIELHITDNGVGFDLEKVLEAEPHQRGFGLASMRERTELSGGDYSLQTAPGQGTGISTVWQL